LQEKDISTKPNTVADLTAGFHDFMITGPKKSKMKQEALAELEKRGVGRKVHKGRADCAIILGQ
jgi:hypothetical protein